MTSLVLRERHGRVALLRLNRPEALNALNVALMQALEASLVELEADESVGCVVITGSDKAFAAGADIKAMQSTTYMQAYKGDYITKHFECIAHFRKPVIAAVAGYALGGGCEIAMMCDLILAADNAKFGQPEIKLGTIPGAGGTQRLVRAVGKAKAMELCLTGRMMDAKEAEASGLVARIVPLAELVPDALKTAQTIAEMSLPVAMMVKECINQAFNTTLRDGVLFERRVFHSTFALDDQKEGMAAFAEKRKAAFKHQ